MKKYQQKMKNQFQKTDRQEDSQNRQLLERQQQKQNLQQQQLMHSDLHQEYLELFKDIQISELNLFNLSNNFNLKLTKHFQENIKINILQYDLETMVVVIYYGNFALKISVLFTNLGNEFFSENLIVTGSFGVVYMVNYKGQQYALKQIRLKHQESNLQIDPQQIYKEYLLSVVASQLKIGPKIQTLFGYDIIVTQKYAMFLQQYCEKININNFLLMKSQLFQNLATMHSIKFLHMDIKPQNIAYSNLLQRYVFLDFGISKFVKQNIGLKSLTNFAGTLAYCSYQMKICYTLMKKSFVDLYFNDAYSLKQTFKKLKNQQYNKNKNMMKDIYNLTQIIQKQSNAHRYECIDMFSQAIQIFKLHILFKYL